MRRSFLVLTVILSSACSPPAQQVTPEAAGPYLDQTPPGRTAQLFAPGIVSTGLSESSIAVSPDGEEIFFTTSVKGNEVLVTTRLQGGAWTEPEVVPFASRFLDGWPAFHPDGSKLFFHSFRPTDESDSIAEVVSIWFVEKARDGWGPPKPVPPPVNGNGFVCCPSVTKDGTLYYSKKIENGEIVYRSRFVDGSYTTPEPLPEPVNDGDFRIHAVVAPDEGYLIIPLANRPDTINSALNYYVSFRTPDDVWTEWINLGPEVNNGRTGAIPSLSPDGRYLFFEARPERETMMEFDATRSYAELQDLVLSSPSHLSSDIFWISTDFLAELRPGGW